MSSSKTNQLHWTAMKERGSYLGIKIMLAVYKLLGRRAFLIFLYPVVGYFFIAHADARRASFEFLTRVSEHSARRPPGWRDVFLHFISFGESLLDKLAAWTGDIKMDYVTYENKEIVADMHKRKAGGILISAHIGNMELLRALNAAYKNLDVSILVHTKHAANFNQIMKKVNPDSSVSIVQVAEIGPATISLLQERINRGGCVVMLADRLPTGDSRHCSYIPFLGSLAPFPQGPFILASLLKCPVTLIFCVKEAGRHRVIFESFADSIDLPHHQRQKSLQELIARYVARVEAYCVAFPYQWFNFFDFWRQLDRDKKSQ